MRCKICSKTFRSPPPRMRESQICTECQGTYVPDKNSNANPNEQGRLVQVTIKSVPGEQPDFQDNDTKLSVNNHDTTDACFHGYENAIESISACENQMLIDDNINTAPGWETNRSQTETNISANRDKAIQVYSPDKLNASKKCE